VLSQYRATPVEALFRAHNLGEAIPPERQPQLVVVTCMDPRVCLRLPPGFAYVLRTGGARLDGNEFALSLALALGRIRSVALVGHTDCAMANLGRHEKALRDDLRTRWGWPPRAARSHLRRGARAAARIGRVEAFVRRSARALARRYPGLAAAPLVYEVADGRLYHVADDRRPARGAT
jgi:carbonic anhydrase